MRFAVQPAALRAALGLLVAVAAWGQAPPAKVGIINIQEAIIRTKDGQKAANDLQGKFQPKKNEIDRMNNEIEQLRSQLSRGANTMSEEQKQKLMREIDAKTKSLQRETEDAQAELDQEQQRIMGELGQRIMAVIDKYAQDNGYTLILDVSSQQSPVLYASNSINITDEVINLYDRNSPGAVSAPPAPASAPAPAAAPKPSPAKKPAAAK
jgi:outer membrane protein